MRLKMYAGPMWAGKTTRMLDGLDGKRWAWVGHPRNTRRTARDLEVMHPGHKWTRDCCAQVLLFDEVHFWDVYGDGLPIMAWANRPEVQEIRLAGIFHDCYSQFTPFPVWRDCFEAAERAGMEAEFHLLESLKPCGRCGGDKGLYFSVPIGGDRVGDDYITVCSACSREWLAKDLARVAGVGA